MLIEKQTYTNVKSVAGNRTIADLQLVRCEFIGSNLSKFDDPELSLVVRGVTATRCVVKRSSTDGVRFEDVLVDGLTTSNGPTLYGCAFRHVTFKGRIGLIKIIGPNFGLPQDVQDAFTASIARYDKVAPADGNAHGPVTEASVTGPFARQTRLSSSAS